MKKKLVLASSACLVASAMALGGCSGGSKPAETSAAAEKSEAAADATTAAAEGGSSDAMHLSFYYPVNVGGDAAKLIEKICADFNAENPDIVVDPVYTGNSIETVNRLFIARIGVFVTCVFPIQQFFALASASHGNFSTLLRHIQTLSLPKISSGKCSSRTGCFLLS